MDAFKKFLGSSDLHLWSDCLLTLSQEIPATKTVKEKEVDLLVKTIIVSCYVQWLSSIIGEDLPREEAAAIFNRLVPKLKQSHFQNPSDQTLYGVAILAGWYGHQYQAQKIIMDLGREGEENILLIVSKDQRQSALTLGKYISRSKRVFPPIYYFYCDALLAQGSVDEVRKLITYFGIDPSDPMTIDLMGRMFEQTADWHNALDIYSKSKWPLHSYRALICRYITGEVEDQDQQPRDQEILKLGLRNSLNFFEGEISQAEFARTTAFVNACRWNVIDNWVINLELGKLNFRLKRHTESEKHLKKAFEQAPNSCKILIGNLRFTNLTWVGSGDSDYKDLNFEPETLECGREVIAVANDQCDESAQHINTWIAFKTREEELLEKVAENIDSMVRFETYTLLGDRPLAIGALLTGLHVTYYPRLILRALILFNGCNFDSALLFLIDNVMANSAHEFRELWELALDVLTIRRKQSRVSDKYGDINQALEVLIGHIQEQGQHKFQDAMRGFEFFKTLKRQDICISLLNRASVLAENTEEYLQIAIARRKMSWFTSQEGDSLGLNALIKAERESRDQLQRLEIAREFGFYGQLQRARRILMEEQVFKPSNNMSAIAHLVALQCMICLEKEEIQQLFQSAIANLEQLRITGQIKYYFDHFVQRLSHTSGVDQTRLKMQFQELEESDKVMKIASPETEMIQPDHKMEDEPQSQWEKCKQKFSSVMSMDETEVIQLVDEVEACLSSQDLNSKLALWELFNSKTDEILEKAFQVRPEVEPEATPISKSGTIIDDWRAQELTDLWKKYVHAGNMVVQREVMTEIKSFKEGEYQLLLQWEEKRNAEKAPLLKKAYLLMKCSKEILTSIQQHDNREQAWPIFWDLDILIEEDLKRLLTSLDKRMAELSDQWSQDINVKADPIS